MNVDQLNKVRHSICHLMSMAVQEIYPKVGLGVGPFIENGFYQDYDLPESISEQIFPKLEKRIRKMIAQNIEFKQHQVSFEEALEMYKHDPYKTEMIKDLKKAGEKSVSFYKSDWFENLCAGPHVINTSEINPQAFKLTKVAGAYWRGDEKNKMLTRIYGVAFNTKDELDRYVAMLKEAEKRDHKKLGQDLGLFAFSSLVGSGLPLFLPKGNIIKTELERFIRDEKEQRGYSFVSIPHIAKVDLYRKSGHLGKYDAMMPIMTDEEGGQYVIKAMNCPHHFEIYNSEPHSYRDLPYRIAENTAVYRNEKSGELSGLVRVKSLTQDDTHHIIRHDQIESEIKMILGLMEKVYKTFNFTDFSVQISTRDPKHSEKYFGGDALWKKSEDILISAMKEWGRPYVIEEGEAAFYGPKIDIMVKDCLGRKWQLTTVQLDFNQPENFHMLYTGDDGKEHAPAVLHVAILGAVERFMGILIEHYAGAFPVWLAPVQVCIAPVGKEHYTAAQKLGKMLGEEGMRVGVDDNNETVGYKIRKAEKQKIPYMLVVGDREKSLIKLTVRIRGQESQPQMSVAAFVKKVKREIEKKK